jgi:glutamine synthetase adenylyltransferase
MTRSQSTDDRSDLVTPIVLPPGVPCPPDLPLYSRFVQRLHRRYADELPLLPPGPPTRDSLSTAYAALQAKGLDTSAALRVLRQLTLERLAQLDCSRQADLAAVTHGMTWLAEVTLDIAWQQVMADLDTLHGVPTKADGQRAEMWIIGMGKLGALEEYLLVQGREWERFAWMKSRVVAPLSAVVNGSSQALRAVVLPFVFRRYLDYNVFESLRTLHQQIRDHAAKRSAGHPERANDVKLSRGGIREIEFTVQLLQVVRGGQFPELRTRPTLDALQRVAKAGLMPQATANALSEAYVFLRQVEHRIQYLDDQQTHVLPTRDDDLAWIAQTLGHASTCEFLSA